MSMFSSKKQPAIRSLIGEGTMVQGTLRFSDGLRIDGEIQGDVVANANDTSILVISEKAKVTGTVKAGHVIIKGTAVTWGQFFVYQGFNERLGWMHTSSAVDAIDEFQETAVKDGDPYF